jgi:hypothetical protein
VSCYTCHTIDNKVNGSSSIVQHLNCGYIAVVAKTEFLAFRVNPERKRDIQRIADDEQRNISQICEMLLYEGVEAYRKEGPKFMQRLVAKQKLRTK